MTGNKRIFVNIVASYARSLFGIACGLFSTRWVLMALGETDLGLFGVVGSLTLFVMFFNIQFASAISRYFAFSIGEAARADSPEAGIEECKRWFNVAVCIHTVLPLILVIVGYPIGAYAMTHGYLVIPPDRVEACVWVWRFACATCLVSMMGVPYQGMYTAKQHIAELTVYNVAQTAVRTVCVYFMALRPGDWLVEYAGMMMAVAVVPSVIIAVRAMCVFPECRFEVKYFWDVGRMRKVLSYVTWQVVGSAGYVARTSGVALVVNRFFGPKMNAAMGIGNTLANETTVLTGALTGAFSPAITTACGAGDEDYMRRMAFRACKFGTLLTLIFALPLVLEAKEVLVLWLKDPPAHSATLCFCLVVCIVLEKLTIGHTMAVNASGNVARYQLVHGIMLSAALVLSIVLCCCWRSVWSIGIALVGSLAAANVADVIMAKRSVGMSPRHWLNRIVLPLALASLLSLSIGMLPSLLMTASFARVCVTVAVTLLTLLPLSWFLVLTLPERKTVHDKIMVSFRRRG